MTAVERLRELFEPSECVRCGRGVVLVYTLAGLGVRLAIEPHPHPKGRIVVMGQRHRAHFCVLPNEKLSRRDNS